MNNNIDTTFNNMNELNDLIKFATDGNIVDFETVKENLIKMKRDAILKNHKFKIWQGKGKDKRWKTHLPPDNRLISKTSKEDLENAIVDYYNEFDKNPNLTLNSFYPEWIKYKELHTSSSGYVHRIDNDWNKYYKDTPIIDVPLMKLSYLELDEWAHKMVKDNDLTKKQYYNMQIIMKQALEYAVEKELIASSPFRKVKVDGKIFRIDPKKPSDTQVFLVDEQPLITEEAYADFKKTGNGVCLSIPLAFLTGLRLGELVELKETDVKGNYLHIERSTVRVHRLDKKDLKWKVVGHTTANRGKTPSSTRKVHLIPEALDIIHTIIKANKKNGYHDNDYLFVNNKGKITPRAITYRLGKYCEHVGIEKKSVHKIRKTFISALIDSDININYIRELVGHEDERTTLKNYCYNRFSDEQTEKQLEKALSGTKWNQNIS